MAAAQLGALLHQIHRLARPGGPGPHSDRELLDAFAVRDDAAFAALVSRHGPMVLRVCRRVLGHEQDAEDAFQATFLVLAQQARSIRNREALGGWLHGVAYRTAMKAKRGAARRRQHEARVAPPAPQAAPNPSWGEVQAALDEEVQRLPERVRSAFVLHVLEGKRVAEAAAELGCKEGTVYSRLSQARQLLRRRLVRRGIELSALLAALAVAEGAGRAAVPAALAKGAIRYGLLVAAGEPAAGTIPAHVAGLAAGVTRAMFLTKAKTVVVLALIMGLIATGAGALAQQAARQRPAADPAPEARAPKSAPATASPTPAPEKGDRFDVSGRVLGPDGKPVTGARLVFVYASAERAPDKVWATSAADGGFRFSVARRSIEDAAFYGNAWDQTYVVAAAEGHGFAWAHVRPETAGDLTLRLVQDDVPIRGRVLDLQGKPVAGVTVRIEGELLAPADGGSGRTSLRSAAFATLFPPVQTGADGRFRINGIGRDRVANLRVEGPTIATQRVQAVARPGDKAGASPRGVPFDLLAVPTRPVVGVVRDKETRKPLVGVVVRSYRIGGAEDFNGLIRTTTDKNGRYRLVGLPKAEGNAVMAEAWGRTPWPEDLPYLAAVGKVGNAPGLEPVTVDIGLRRGVWVKGRVIDKATGKGVPAGFDYLCFGDNPFARDLPPQSGVPMYWTRKDGSFRVVALPGRGLLGVRASRDVYRMGVGAERIKERLGDGPLLDTLPYQLYPGNEHTVAEFSSRAGDKSVTCDVYLDPGHTLRGTVLGPDGKPLAGARALGLRPMPYWENEPLKTAEFTIQALGSDETRTLEMVHEGKKLAGWRVVRGDDKAPVRVRLEPWGVVTGRLVKPDGEPMTGVTIYAGARGGQPDKAGKFRIDGLAPGHKFGLTVIKPPYHLEISGKDIKDLTTRPGETKDLGDIQVKPME